MKEPPTSLADRQNAAVLVAGRYAFERELGRGAMGRVIVVRDTQSDELRAMKVVPAAHAAALSWELDVLTKVAHPSLVRVHELLSVRERVPAPFSLDRGSALLVEAFVDGERLNRLALTPVTDEKSIVERAWRVLADLAGALAALHARGLLHRDVKPQNVIVKPDGHAVLVDLGLAARAFVATAAGTPRYWAPEAWANTCSERTDLYALAVTVAELLGADTAASAHDERGASSPDAASAMDRDSGTTDVGRWLTASTRRRVRVAQTLPAYVPSGLRELLSSMLAADPAERVSSAAEVARRARVGGSRGKKGSDAADATRLSDAPSALEKAGRVATLPLVGRDRELAALVAAIARGGIVRVRGAEGAGRARLVREAVQRVQRDTVERGGEAPTFHVLSPDAAIPSGVAAVVCFDEGAASPERLAGACLAARIGRQALSIVVLEHERHVTAEAVAEDAPEALVEVGRLGRGDLEALLAATLLEPITQALVDAALDVADGLPGTLCRVVAAAFSSGLDPSRPAVLRGSASVAGTAARDAEDALVLRTLRVSGGELSREALAAVVGEDGLKRVASLRARGVVIERANGRLALRTVVRRAVEREEAASKKLAGKLLSLSWLDADTRAFALAAQEDAEGAERAFVGLLRALRKQGDLEGALDLAGRAREVLPVSVALRFEEADALRAAGRYVEAWAVLDSPVGPLVPLAAEVARMSGRRDDAEALAATIPLDDGHGAAAAVVRARCAFDRADYEAAATLLEQVFVWLEGGGQDAHADGVRVRALELRALLAAVRGDHAAAHADVEACELAAVRAHDEGALARGLLVRASLALGDGRLEEASVAYQAAHARALHVGEAHVLATTLVNLGLTRLELGEPGPALAALRDGAARLARLGRDADVARALYNVANAAALVGDVEDAALAAGIAFEAAVRSDDLVVRVQTRLAMAEAALVTGRLLEAAELGRRAEVEARDAHVSPEARALTDARVALLWSALGDVPAAHAALARCADAEATASGQLLADAALARASVSRAEGHAGAAAEAAERAVELARKHGRFETRFRALQLAAEANELAGNEELAGRRYAEARAALEQFSRSLDGAGRARLRRVPSYAKTLQVGAAMPTTSGTRQAKWRVLVAHAQRFRADEAPSRLYRQVVDGAVDLLEAERGFLVARAPDGTLRLRATHGLPAGAMDLERARVPWSRSIVTRAMSEARPVTTFDATTDARFDAESSVHALALRSVLAVPMRLGDAPAALYVEDRLRRSAFADDDVQLLGDYARLAEVAIAASLHLRSERRAATREAALRDRLEQVAAGQARELVSLRRTTPAESLFANLVGRGPAMERALDLVARVATANVPVLVTGESGVGKELVARAIHDASVRRAGPFISENCGAIPDTLFESILFGHVKGAFTGASSARAGLFESADGGTLFLDEVGELSASAQAKLLRVLQDGEVRPVGSDRARKVDVRVVAATHRSLADMVARGSFRQDLYYRLAVVTVPLPALRERREEIPALVAHFVQKHAAGRAVRVDASALARLSAAEWPGNVRQLENEVQRALLLCDDVLTEKHLSPELRGSSLQTTAKDALDLKAQTEELERRLVGRALEESDGNLTHAARKLGVSRFGLQKMVKRLGIGA